MAEHNKEVLLGLYNDFEIENTSDPKRQHEFLCIRATCDTLLLILTQLWYPLGHLQKCKAKVQSDFSTNLVLFELLMSEK